MANTTTSPNMSMPVPTVGEDPGPDWATNLDACLSVIDSHNHTPGQGVQITPNGMNINSDLPINSNNIITARSLRFSSQVAPINGSSDLGCVYESGVDLYYNDGNGNQIRITQGGAVTGATGTITGLPSGTASASFAGGTFTFQSATNTPAALAVGPTTIAQAVSSGKGVTISANGAQAANYNLTLPVSLPGSTSLLSVDSSGNMANVATTGSGNVVLATSPSITTPAFSGVSTGTITSDVFSPTVTQNYVSGGTITFTVSAPSSRWYYIRVGNHVMVQGAVVYTTSGFTSTANYTWQATIPIATTAISSAGTFTDLRNSLPNVLADVSNTAVVSTSPTAYNGNISGTAVFSYMYQII